MDYVILRPSNVIGADMKNGSFFALVKAVSRGRYFLLAHAERSPRMFTPKTLPEHLLHAKKL
jgi:nucleoside-diphosphate-sugar epimerase